MSIRIILWRVLQIVVPVLVMIWFWSVIPKPIIHHTPVWLDAQAKKAAYQLKIDDTAGIQRVLDQANALVSRAKAELPGIADITSRLERMANYEAALEQTLSHLPNYPACSMLFAEDIRTAAGLNRGMINISATDVETIQSHPELLGAGLAERDQLLKANGLIATEPSSLTIPHYTLWTIRWILLFFLAGWAGVLILAAKAYDFGYNPVAEARRELGSWPAIILVAPIANLFLLEEFEDGQTQNGRRVIYLGVTHESQIVLRTKSALQALPIMLTGLWQYVTWRDVLRLSYSFRYAAVISLALVVNLAVMQLAWAGDVTVVEDVVTVNGDGTTHNLRLLLPDPGGGTWQFEFDPQHFDNSAAVGYRGRLRAFTKHSKLQPRFIVVTNDGGFNAAKLQGLLVGTVVDNHHPYYFFSSIKLPKQGRTSLYNELGVDLSSYGHVTLSGVVIEDNQLGQSASWKIGPELRFNLGKVTLKLYRGFGLGGTGDESRIWLTVPVG